jgi:hypothetical protein
MKDMEPYRRHRRQDRSSVRTIIGADSGIGVRPPDRVTGATDCCFKEFNGVTEVTREVTSQRWQITALRRF